MDTETYNRITETTQRVIDMLIERNYSGIEQLCGGIRLSSSDLALAVREYGRTLCRLPEDGWRKLNVIEVAGITPAKFSVRVNLWTLEEGQSDLSLELTLTDEGNTLGVEIDDLHVL